ncbi:MAG: GNAT family N-acetyltransferase [Pseudodesulfovibrio sp.]
MTLATFIPCTDASFDGLWRELVDGRGPSWRYEPSHLAYYRSSFGANLLGDVSFAVVGEEGVVAVAPLFLIERGGVRTFSLNGDFLPAPFVSSELGKNKYEKVQKAVYGEIDRLASEWGVQAARFRIDALCRMDSYNVLQKYGYLDCSMSTAVVHLERPMEDLWADLRKSYKAIINKALRVYAIETVDGAAGESSLFADYCDLHFKAAGRSTRPENSYRQQRQAVANDKAALFVLKSEGRPVACAYFLHHGAGAFYGSLADDPDFTGPVATGHALLWTAINYYRDRGFSALELGLQQYSPQLFYVPTEKEWNISLYKRGFGGVIEPMYQGIKYYDADLLHRELAESSARLCRAAGGEGVHE